MIENLDITRFRTETRPETVQLRDPESEELLDLTGSYIRMAINSVEDPAETDLPEFEMIGTVSATPTDGLATFEPTQYDADRVGLYYCDIRVTLASGIVVYPAKGTWSFEENVTEGEPAHFEWTPSTTPPDGATVSFDGSNEFYVVNIYDIPTLPTYQTREGRRVIRTAFDNTAGGQYATMAYLPRGSDFTRQVFPGYGWEWKITAYLNLGSLTVELQDGLYANICYPAVDQRFGAAEGSLYGSIQTADAAGLVYNSATPTDLSSFAEAWYVVGVRIDTDGLVYGCTVREQDAEEWILMNPNPWPPALIPVLLQPYLWARPVHPYNAAALIDIWKFAWRKL